MGRITGCSKLPLLLTPLTYIRVGHIDVSICQKCGGEAKVIACIEDQVVIDKILRHLQAKGSLPPPPDLLPAARAPPALDWFA